MHQVPIGQAAQEEKAQEQTGKEHKGKSHREKEEKGKTNADQHKELAKAEKSYLESISPDSKAVTLRKRLPCLIVCPTTLIGHWQYEVERYFNQSTKDITEDADSMVSKK